MRNEGNLPLTDINLTMIKLTAISSASCSESRSSSCFRSNAFSFDKSSICLLPADGALDNCPVSSSLETLASLARMSLCLHGTVYMKICLFQIDECHVWATISRATCKFSSLVLRCGHTCSTNEIYTTRRYNTKQQV